MPTQKPNTKNIPALQNMAAKASQFSEHAMKSLFALAVKLGQAHEIAGNNYNLGLMHMKRGNIDDAILRFKIVTWVEPKRAQAWYFLGNSYFAAGKAALAVGAYKRALELKPDHVEAPYMLALARGKKTPADELPKKMPLSMVKAHFEERAESYDKDQLETYQYQGPKLMDAAVRAHIVKGRVDHELLDMGVGTGLCGAPLRDVVSEMTGVDISERMVALAMQRVTDKKKKIYDVLIRREIHEFLVDARDASYDIVLAGCLLSYIGEATPLFAQLQRILKPGGLCVYTADRMEGSGFALDTEQARFAFSQAYLSALARANGFTELSLEKSPVYPDLSMWLGVLKKQ